MNRKKPTIHQIKTVATSRLFRVEELDLEFSNGEKRIYERIASRGHGAVLIIPLLRHENKDDEILLIREYAAGTDRYELAFPKGKVEQGEDILTAANREIMEEVGYESRKINLLKKLSLAPGYMGHVTSIILAEDLIEHREPGDEPEEIDVIPWKVSELGQLIERDDFAEGRSVAALYLLDRYLSQNA